MSGGQVAYHLRTNKFIERQLFLELLDFVRIWNGPTHYLYASMGGQYLEDFRLVHERFAIDRMLSFEKDEGIVRRQIFNNQVGCIECKHLTSADFVRDFPTIQSTLSAGVANCATIVWLDYAEANKKGEQLQEYEALVRQLAAGDVIKITLNANPQSYRRRADFRITKDYVKAVSVRLEEELDQYTPAAGASESDLTPEGYAKFLASAASIAGTKGVDGGTYELLPLASYRYSDDNHQMLTLTAVVMDDPRKTTMQADEAFNAWPFRSNDWADVHQIDVPHLSYKERHLIGKWIGRLPEVVMDRSLPFPLDSNSDKSRELLSSYVAHYRRYPSFGRTFI